MNAYKGIISKKEFLKELKKHQKADNFIKGKYWDDLEQKGCAVGCSLKSISVLKNINVNPSSHAEYPNLLGVPAWLARVEDQIFEGLPLRRSKKWPVEFAQAIHSGADLEKINGPFLIIILKSVLKSFDHEKYPKLKDAVNKTIRLWQRTDIGSKDFIAAANYAAAYAAYAAYATAAHSAAAYYAANSAAYATAAAATTAADAADAANATAAAIYAAAHSAAAHSAAAATTKKYSYFADELIKLLKGCKPKKTQ